MEVCTLVAFLVLNISCSKDDVKSSGTVSFYWQHFNPSTGDVLSQKVVKKSIEELCRFINIYTYIVYSTLTLALALITKSSWISLRFQFTSWSVSGSSFFILRYLYSSHFASVVGLETSSTWPLARREFSGHSPAVFAHGLTGALSKRYGKCPEQLIGHLRSRVQPLWKRSVWCSACMKVRGDSSSHLSEVSREKRLFSFQEHRSINETCSSFVQIKQLNKTAECLYS